MYMINIKKEKEVSLKTYQNNQKHGLNIHNFISTFNYELVILSEQIILFEKYLEFFYNTHENIFKTLFAKIIILNEQLNIDITIDNIDKEIIKDHTDKNTLNTYTSSDDDRDPLECIVSFTDSSDEENTIIDEENTIIDEENIIIDEENTIIEY